MKHKRIVIGLLATAVTVILFAFIIQRAQLDSSLEIEAVPSGVAIVLDGRGIRQGTTKVSPGDYDIEVKKEGFLSQKKRVLVKKSERVYVGVSLSPNSESTKNWYRDHADDARKAEGISSKNFDFASEKQTNELPVLKYLPFEAHYFSISSGRSLKYPDDSNKVGIYINAETPTGRQFALDWLRSKGQDPSTLEIIFSKKAIGIGVD